MVCRKGVSHQRCAGWLQRLSFLVVCREGMGIGAVVDAMGCGIGGVGIGGFCRRVFVDFC